VLIGILVALLVVAVAAGLFTWIRRAAACQRVIDAPGGELEFQAYGGVMCRALTTSGALVRLDLLDWGVRLRGIPISRWIVPRWEARYDELAIAELVATQFSRNAIWFRLRGEAGGMGFLSEHSPTILKVLERHGVPVNRSVQQIKGAADLYSPRP
jgi:hypothetical protein